MEATSAFTPPQSVISFSLGDAAATGFGEAQHRLSTPNSVANSAVDLQHRHTGTPREAFSSPRPRPPTVMYGVGQRSRPFRRKRPMSTMLSGELTKPWVGKKDKAARISYFLTYSMLLLGIAASALRCYFSWRHVPLLDRLCLVMEDDFSSDELDTGIWMREADMGGFG
jgi:hypothetical protein